MCYLVIYSGKLKFYQKGTLLDFLVSKPYKGALKIFQQVEWFLVEKWDPVFKVWSMYSELQNLWTELGIISLVDPHNIGNKTWKQQYLNKTLLYKLEIRLQAILIFSDTLFPLPLSYMRLL